MNVSALNCILGLLYICTADNIASLAFVANSFFIEPILRFRFIADIFNHLIHRPYDI